MIKRLLTYLLVWLLVFLPVPSFSLGTNINLGTAIGGPPFDPTVVYTSVTLNLSTVAGTAFITNASGSIPWASYLNREVTISDGTNTCAGYIKAVGTGETLDSETAPPNSCTDPANDVDVTTGWSAGYSALLDSVAGGETGNCLSITENGAASPYAANNLSGTKGALYKVLYSIKAGTEATVRVYVTNVQIVYFENNVEMTAEWQARGPKYFTSWPETGLVTLALINMASMGSGANMFFDNVSVKPVLTPSATGCTIVSTRGGSTYNWASNGGINANAASFTVTIGP